MARFRLTGTTTVVDAVPFSRNAPGATHVRDEGGKERAPVYAMATKTGWLFPEPGDWVATDADGNRRLVSSEDLAMMYEPV